MPFGNRDQAYPSLLRCASTLLACLMLVVALHHVAPHGGIGAGADHCTLCILLSAVVLTLPALAVVAAAPGPAFSPCTAECPLYGRDLWTSWSHRGPPSLVS